MSPDLFRVLNRLAKWRSVFAGWQLGTRLSTDPESQAVRDHREVTMILRVEVSALAELLVARNVFTKREWELALIREAEALEASLEGRFPGFKATHDGITMDVAKASETMKNWRP